MKPKKYKKFAIHDEIISLFYIFALLFKVLFVLPNYYDEGRK